MSYCTQDEISIIELSDLEERSSEEEKEEKDSKELQDHSFSLGDLHLLSNKQLSDWGFGLSSIYHLEIHTPPPKFLV